MPPRPSSENWPLLLLLLLLLLAFAVLLDPVELLVLLDVELFLAVEPAAEAALLEDRETGREADLAVESFPALELERFLVVVDEAPAVEAEAAAAVDDLATDPRRLDDSGPDADLTLEVALVMDALPAEDFLAFFDFLLDFLVLPPDADEAADEAANELALLADEDLEADTAMLPDLPPWLSLPDSEADLEADAVLLPAEEPDFLVFVDDLADEPLAALPLLSSSLWPWPCLEERLMPPPPPAFTAFSKFEEDDLVAAAAADDDLVEEPERKWRWRSISLDS